MITSRKNTPINHAEARNLAFTEIREAITDYSEDLDAANTYTNRDLNPDGIRRRKETLRAQARNAATTRATIALETLRTLADKADTQAEPHRLTAHPDDTAELTRTAQAWEYNILPQLNDGKRWEDILNGITRDDAIALQRFAPAYTKAHANHASEAEAHMRFITTSIEAMQAQLATTPQGAELIQTAHILHSATQRAEELLHTITNASTVQQLAFAQIAVSNTLAFE